jgi:hypothetical protein
MTITATADGLRPATVVVQTTPVGPKVDMAKDLPIHPSPRPIAAAASVQEGEARSSSR